MLEKNEIKNVKSVFLRLIDSKKGFELAAEKANEARHRRLFAEMAKQREEYAKAIRLELAQNDEILEMEDGTGAGDMHRFFMNIKAYFDNHNNDDEALLECIVSGDKNLIKQYEDAIESTKSNLELREKFQRQYREIVAEYDLFKAKEEAA